MTTSELILSKIASRLAVMVVLGLLGHLPDQHHQPPITQANAIETSAVYPQASSLENRPNDTVGYPHEAAPAAGHLKLSHSSPTAPSSYMQRAADPAGRRKV